MLDASTTGALRLEEVARTRRSVHYATGRADVPVLCVARPDAVLLPASLVAASLPSGPLRVAHGRLCDRTDTWQVTRWWRPPRPRGLAPPVAPPRLPGVDIAADVVPHDLVGLGPGLTPTGDDVVAGALVAAHATGHPGLAAWQEQTRAALRVRRTTEVSRGLLHHALDGYAVPELEAFLAAACAGEAQSASARPLLAVGHSSGAALAAGALHVLHTHPVVRRGAA
jgi:uncharacterized protein DUF2877